MKSSVIAYFDGAVEPFNPGGHGGYGALVLRGDEVLLSEAIYIGRWADLSNNVAEYAGAIAVLRFLIREGIESAKVYGDADVVINQLNGDWKAREGAYIPYYREAFTLRKKLPGVRFEWIPRKMNARADELSKEAVTVRPLVCRFELDKTLALDAPLGKKRKRKRGKPQMAISESMAMFNQRYGDL